MLLWADKAVAWGWITITNATFQRLGCRWERKAAQTGTELSLRTGDRVRTYLNLEEAPILPISCPPGPWWKKGPRLSLASFLQEVTLCLEKIRAQESAGVWYAVSRTAPWEAAWVLEEVDSSESSPSPMYCLSQDSLGHAQLSLAVFQVPLGSLELHWPCFPFRCQICIPCPQPNLVWLF